MRMTTKQIQLLTCLANKNPDGSNLDLDQLLDQLADNHNWETTKASLQFSIRTLINEGVVKKEAREKRRGRLRAVLSITPLGLSVLGR